MGFFGGIAISCGSQGGRKGGKMRGLFHIYFLVVDDVEAAGEGGGGFAQRCVALHYHSLKVKDIHHLFVGGGWHCLDGSEGAVVPQIAPAVCHADGINEHLRADFGAGGALAEGDCLKTHGGVGIGLGAVGPQVGGVWLALCCGVDPH